MYELASQVPAFFGGGIRVYDSGFPHLEVRQHTVPWARVRRQYVGIQHLVQEPLTLLAKIQSAAQPGSRAPNQGRCGTRWLPFSGWAEIPSVTQGRLLIM